MECKQMKLQQWSKWQPLLLQFHFAHRPLSHRINQVHLQFRENHFPFHIILLLFLQSIHFVMPLQFNNLRCCLLIHREKISRKRKGKESKSKRRKKQRTRRSKTGSKTRRKKKKHCQRYRRPFFSILSIVCLQNSLQQCLDLVLSFALSAVK